MTDLTEYQPKNIIVRMPNWIGDLVMATPILHHLKSHYPTAKLTAMCRHPLGQLLEKDPHVDEVFSFTRPKGFFRRNLDRNIIAKLKQGDYDLGILLTNSLSSAWLFWQGDVKIRLGYDKFPRGLILTHPQEFDEEAPSQHLVHTYEHLLEEFGIHPTSSDPKLYVSDTEIKQAHLLLKTYGILDHHIIIGINPGAAYGSAKCWLPERFKKLSLQLLALNPDIRLVFFGDPSSASLVKSICADLPKEAINLASATSLRELMALIKLCKVLLTNDSGPMHMADALSTPLVALFGSTSPTKTGPFHQPYQVIYKKASCSPCYKRECPIDFRCMKSIQTEDVFQAIEKLLNKDFK